VLRNLPVGLLWDLYCPSDAESEGDEGLGGEDSEVEGKSNLARETTRNGLPWKIEAGEGLEYDIHDTFVNSVKEVITSTLP
jgi:hypothetical protein